jgi:hypothetical protein
METGRTLETAPVDGNATAAVSPNRCVIVLDRDLPIGQAANAAAVISVTIGQRHPVLVGEQFVDASGSTHPGLIPIGIAVLAASRDDLRDLRRQGLEAGCDIVDLPVAGQQTTDYHAFREMVAVVEAQDLEYVGIALIGRKKQISKIVGRLGLLK